MPMLGYPELCLDPDLTYPPQTKNIIHPLRKKQKHNRSGVLNVRWTNVKVKNRPRIRLGWPGWFFGDAKLRKAFQGGPWSRARYIHEVKWGPRNGMVSMDLVLNVFISFFWGGGKDSNAFLTCASFFLTRGGSKEQLSNTNYLNLWKKN